MKPTLVILAAGLGSRYGGLKQMDKFGPSGETIIEYSIYDAIRAGFGKVVFVIRETMEEDLKDTIISKVKDKIECAYVFQELKQLPDGFTCPPERQKPWGTAHAVLSAEPKTDGPFVVINADDFYGYDSYKLMAEFFSTSDITDYEYAMIGFHLKNTISEYGSVSRGVCKVDDNNNLLDIIERTNIRRTDKGLEYFTSSDIGNHLDEDEIVSMNFWGFNRNAFDLLNKYFSDFLKENINTEKAEFYIPWATNEWITKGICKIKVIPALANWFGVTYKEDKDFVQRSLNKLISEGQYPINIIKIIQDHLTPIVKLIK